MKLIKKTFRREHNSCYLSSFTILTKIDNEFYLEQPYKIAPATGRVINCLATPAYTEEEEKNGVLKYTPSVDKYFNLLQIHSGYERMEDSLNASGIIEEIDRSF